ncbi:MAG: 4-hydroxy-tetrahydrodipicolinate reductase [Verrucomicrobiota bacterium]|nr:4-hydroxy-tetrahydrodipicolinate reductase [Verrucomicrobiota bacterium]
MIKTAIIGAAGRMGINLINCVLADPELELSGAVEYNAHPDLGKDIGLIIGKGETGIILTDNIANVANQSDAIIDFSSADSAADNAKVCAETDTAFVLGTTGVSEESTKIMQELASKNGRIVFAPNMSIGVNLLFHLSSKVAKILGTDYDIEVVEMHHRRKKDAPSGTAVRMAEILADARGLSYQDDVKHGREGFTGERTVDEIGVHALRGGDVVGDHTIIYAADGERVELTHKASSRETFAKGALRAVKFLHKASPALYDMQDVLGLK